LFFIKTNIIFDKLIQTIQQKFKIMGLKNYSEGGIYLSIAEGKLVRQFKDAIKDITVSRINKNGKTVHEQKFDYIEGKITNLRTNINDYGKQWIVELTDDEANIFKINIMYSSRYANSFLRCLPNIDLSKSVKLQPWSLIDKKDPTKTVTGITMWQDNIKIEPFYTKEVPNGCPPMVQVKFKGELKWDSSDLDAFLEEKSLVLFNKAVVTDGPKEDDDLPD